MAKLFSELRERLLRAGVAPRHVRRYLAELADHLADLRAEEEAAGHSRADAESAALVRLGGTDELARAMIEKRQFQSWCLRAPWATFGVAPLCLLAGAWFVACFILWSGWKIFMPGTDTPFGATAGPIYRAREYLFSDWQDDLFWRADSDWVGNWARRRPSEIEGDLADCRSGAYRTDGWHGPGARGPAIRRR